MGWNYLSIPKLQWLHRWSLGMAKYFHPSNQMPSKVWDEITYPFPNFNGATVEVWEWLSIFIPHFVMDELLIHAWIKVDPGYIRCEQTKQYSYIQGIPGKKTINVEMCIVGAQYMLMAIHLTRNQMCSFICCNDNVKLVFHNCQMSHFLHDSHGFNCNL